MPFKGMDKAKKQLKRLENIASPTERTMQSWLIVVGTEAAVMTPIDTSLLLNSQYKEQMSFFGVTIGRIGYAANYAQYVHDPKYPMNFRRATAEKEFLLKAIIQTEETRMKILRKNIDEFIKGKQ